MLLQYCVAGGSICMGAHVRYNWCTSCIFLLAAEIFVVITFFSFDFNNPVFDSVGSDDGYYYIKSSVITMPETCHSRFSSNDHQFWIFIILSMSEDSLIFHIYRDEVPIFWASYFQFGLGIDFVFLENCLISLRYTYMWDLFIWNQSLWLHEIVRYH